MLSMKRQSISTAGRKRSSSCTEAPLPPSKRTCSSSATTDIRYPAQWNRVHRSAARLAHAFFTPHYGSAAITAELRQCINPPNSFHVGLTILRHCTMVNGSHDGGG